MATTISGTAGVTFPAGGLGNTAGAVVGTTDTQTLTNKTLTTPNIDSAQFATVSGTAPIYPCRAWVNFNGTGTVAIRASGNVSSITDGGTGLYTVNMTTAMSDVNYSAVCATGGVIAAGGVADGNRWIGSSVVSTSACSITQRNSGNTLEDGPQIFVSIFR